MTIIIEISDVEALNLSVSKAFYLSLFSTILSNADFMELVQRLLILQDNKKVLVATVRLRRNAVDDGTSDQEYDTSCL